MSIDERSESLISRLEGEVWDKHRELARQELEKRLQEEASKQGRFSPLNGNVSQEDPPKNPDDQYAAG